MTIEELEKTHFQWVMLGKYYGYPECCIIDFCVFTPSCRTPNQDKVHKFHGFIPCPKCATKIVEEGLKIEDIIVDRQCKTAYPIDISDKLPYNEAVEEVKRIAREYRKEKC